MNKGLINALLSKASKYIEENKAIVTDAEISKSIKHYLGTPRIVKDQNNANAVITVSERLIMSSISLKIKPDIICYGIRNDGILIGRKFKRIDKIIRSKGYYVLYAEPIGKPNLIKLKIFRSLQNLLPFSPIYSPYYIAIYKQGVGKKYKPSYSFFSRLKRVLDRAASYTRDSIAPKILSNNLVENIYHNIDTKINKRKAILVESNYCSRIINHKKPNTIIVSMTWLEYGGVEKVMLNLIKGLNSRGFNIILFTSVASANPWHSIFKDYCLEIVHLPDLLGKSYKHYYGLYISKCAEINDAVSLITTNSMPGYQAAELIKKSNPAVVTIDILHTHGTPEDRDAFLRKSLPYRQYLEHRVVISEYLRKYYLRKYPVKPENISVIYNGLDDEQFNHKPNPVMGHKIINSRKDEISIVFMGRLDPDKSPMRLVEIAEKLTKIKDAEKVKIYVCGPGSLFEEMLKQIEDKKLKNISLVGPVNNPIDIFAAADFSILTSDAEGIPMSILESFKAGCIPIMPAVGGIPEMIDDGIDGILVNFSNTSEKEKVDNMTSAIVKGINIVNCGDYAAMSKATKKKLETKFSHMTEDYIKLINR